MAPASPPVAGIRLTVNPRSEVWQAPLPAAGLSVLLIGWITPISPVEAGVPLDAARILSGSMARLGVITAFAETPVGVSLAPDQWHVVSGGWAIVLSDPASRLTRRRPWSLLATQDAGIAQQLFESSPFDWNQQAQMALLSEPGHPPALERRLVEQAFDRSAVSAALRDLHLLGILYPGVDGDFAALVSNEPAFLENFKSELEHACGAAGIPFAVVSEDEFRRTRWRG